MQKGSMHTTTIRYSLRLLAKLPPVTKVTGSYSWTDSIFVQRIFIRPAPNLFLS